MKVIPKQCLSILPFSAEPISVWTDDTDLSKYLYHLFDKPSVIIDQTGKKYEGNYSSYWEHILDRGIEKFRYVRNQFQKNAQQAVPAPAAEDQEEPTRDLENDRNFGLMAKYSISWDGSLSEVLSESAFFSLEHILEAGSELNCSILLSSNLYFKQALQTLRNYLENMVLQLHFCDNQSDFSLWKDGKFRTPSLRGKKGLLKSLIARGLLSSELAHIAEKLYGELNESIHGAESRLIHRGVFEGKWSGVIFKYERFREWCDFFATSVNFGINILYLHIEHWENVHPKGRIQCDVCHSEDFKVEKSEFAGLLQTTLTCRKCGSSMTYDAEWAARFGY